MNPAKPSSTAEVPVVVGSAAHRYRALAHWQQLPAGWSLEEVAGVATDSAGNALVFNRGAHPVIVFDRAGNFLRSWGEGVFQRPHGITIGPDDSVYCVDDSGHTVHKFTPEGRLLLTLGANGRPSDTGATSVDYRTIRRAAGPFHYPTNLALAPNGDIYVADGYGNARVHRFAPDGRYIASWGEPGTGRGQFHVPHGIAIDRQGIVYVADRENSRLQLFTPAGVFLAAWTDVARPSEVFIDAQGHVLVAELGFRAGMFPGNQPPPGQTTGGRFSVFDAAGKLLARWGGGDTPCAAGDFFAPHDVWVDAFGDIYVGEVTLSAGGRAGLVSPDCHCLQKFALLPAEELP
ncbi:MAG: peptidyl-alpha-hydroxyglycine alpha-amidating lyase family protein [Pirellulales bacterium]